MDAPTSAEWVSFLSSDMAVLLVRKTAVVGATLLHGRTRLTQRTPATVKVGFFSALPPGTGPVSGASSGRASGLGAAINATRAAR